MEIRVVVSLSAEAEAMVERLVVALGRAARAMAAPEGSDDRQPVGSPSPLHTGPLPVLAAEQGAGEALAVEVSLPPPAPPVVRHSESLAKARVTRWSGATWLTAEREAVLKAGWEAGEDVHVLAGRMAEMAGPAIPNVRALAQKAWTRGFKRPEGYKPLLGRPKSAAVPLRWQTAERLAELRRLVEEEAASWPRVTEVLSAMPGAAVPQFRESLKRWAKENGIAGPGQPASSWRNPARRAVLERDWPAGVNVREIRDAMVALPGLPVPEGIVALGVWANDMGLRRPDGHRGVVNRPLAPVAAKPAWTPPGGKLALAPRPVMMGPQIPKAYEPIDSGMPAGRQPPPLPEPRGETGRVYAPFRAIAAWAGFYGVAYDGGNIDRVNKLRAAKGLPLVVQDDSVPMPAPAPPPAAQAEGMAA